VPDIKPTTYRVYLGTDDNALLTQLARHTELRPEELLKKLAVAGMHALMANEMRLTLPLRFVIRDPALAEAQHYVLNEMERRKPRAK
jgi:hypothetical protein